MNIFMISFLTFTSLLLSLMESANSAIYTNLYWRKQDVKVCFADVGSAQGPKYIKWNGEEQKVIDIVTKEFTLERTGMEFIGFEHCETASYKPDIIIYLTKVSKAKIILVGGILGSSTVGHGLFHVDQKYPGARGRIILTTAGLNYSTIVHEFGHSAGLFHEHDHFDAHELDRCKHTKKENQRPMAAITQNMTPIQS